MPKKKISQTTQLLRWLDDNLLLLLSAVLLIFIPLFPKVPFFSPIERYIVRVRLEDFLVLGTALAWLVQLLRNKVNWNSPLTGLILAYVGSSFLSLLSAVFLINTIPMLPDHLLKSALHFFRYIEYFSLFFIVFASIKNRRQVELLLGVIVATLLAVIVYGYGQKYHYWPVYSTMNREFSKGVRLYLTEHARVQSTFAGHYDLAAYLVIVLPLVLALTLTQTKRAIKIGLGLIHFLGVWLLILSASRTSFAAYGLAISLVILLVSWQYDRWLPRLKYFFSRFFGTWLVVAILMLMFGGDISDRFVQVIKSSPQLSGPYQTFTTQTDRLAEQIGWTEQNWLKVSLGPDSAPPPNSISVEDAEVMTQTDERPTPYLPADVYEDIPDRVQVATKSADGTEQIIEVEQPRVWSENAKKYGLSFAIRLDTLWPQALAGFMKNPLLGSGYATLNKRELTDFTIAESTDNNFLRTLGETGLLGFITFYGVMAMALYHAAKALSSSDRLLKALAIGYISGSIGILFNAIYIDVFAASKVAFTFWSITGLFLGYYMLKSKHETKI